MPNIEKKAAILKKSSNNLINTPFLVQNYFIYKKKPNSDMRRSVYQNQALCLHYIHQFMYRLST